MTLQCLHTLTTWDDDTDTVIVDLLTDRLGDLLHVLRQWHHHFQVVVAQAQAPADRLELIRTGRVLSTCHCRRQVITDDDGDIGILIDGIQQSRHT